MFASPFYSSYYNPYDSYYAHQHAVQQLEERRRAEAHARRAQYIPHEIVEEDEECYPYANPWQRAAYAEELRREALERERERLEAIKYEQEAREQYLQHLRAQAKPRSPFQFPQRKSTSPPPAAASKPQSPQSQPQPKSSSSPSPPASHAPSLDNELHNNAAIKIQTLYRIHRAHHTISSIASNFDTLTASFAPPEAIDFQTPKGIITLYTTQSLPREVDTRPLLDSPTLAFTPTNYTLHAYTEALNRLLIKLDAVESWGDASVRKARRRVVSAVESESSRVDAFWKNVWATRFDSPTGTDETPAGDVSAPSAGVIEPEVAKLEEPVQVEEEEEEPVMMELLEDEEPVQASEAESGEVVEATNQGAVEKEERMVVDDAVSSPASLDHVGDDALDSSEAEAVMVVYMEDGSNLGDGEVIHLETTSEEEDTEERQEGTSEAAESDVLPSPDDVGRCGVDDGMRDFVLV